MNTMPKAISQALPEKSTTAGFIITHSPDKNFRGYPAAVLNTLFPHPFGKVKETICFSNYAITVFSVEENSPFRKCSTFSNQRCFSYLQGDFVDPQILYSKNCAETAFRLFEQGNHNLKNIKGSYSGFVYDKVKKELHLYCDPTGIEKLYYYSNESVFLASNNLYAIVSNPAIDFKANTMALTETILYQFPTGRATIESNTSVLLPNEILVKNNQIYIEKCKSFSFNRRQTQGKQHGVQEALDNYFLTAAKALEKPVGLFLSMGKDSRILLGMLRKHNLPYSLFNFTYGSTGPLDALNVAKLAICAGKSLHIVPSYKSSLQEDIALAMGSTFHTEWMSVANLAYDEGLNVFMLGTAADAWAGKLESFRNPAVKDRATLFKVLLKNITKGSTFRYDDSIPWLETEEAITDHFLQSCSGLDEEHLCDIEILWILNYRSFRNTYPILNRCRFFGTALHPFMDTDVMNEYFRLPLSQIRSQQLHTSLACRDHGISSVPSIDGKLPLSLEKYLRTPILKAVRHKAGKRSAQPVSLSNDWSRTYSLKSSMLRELAGKDSITVYTLFHVGQ